MNLYGGIKVFSQEEMYKIHQAAMHILQEVGLELDLSDESLQELQKKGLKVDFANHRVRFPPELILETIQQLSGAPTPEITEEGTDKPPQPLRMPKQLWSQGGTQHGFVYDVDHGGMRPATHQDMYDFIKLKRNLKDMRVTPCFYPQDVPQDVAPVHAAAVAVKYCEDPVAPDVKGLEDLPWVERVMQAAGVWGPDHHKIAGIYPISPLRLAGRGAELLEFQAKRGDLSFVVGMVIPGFSSPITLVGHTAIVLAEEFGFNTAYRLLVPPPNNRFSPRSIGDDVIIMDLRRGAYVHGSPEVSLLRLATHQIAGEFYKFPGSSDHGIRLFSNAKEPGIQAAMEGALQAMADLARGIYSYDEDVSCRIDTLGSLCANLCTCLEQTVIDHEMVQYLLRFIQGIEVNDETIALNLIAEVGPGGTFLETDHTLRHYRREMWFPELLHRGPWDAWVQFGRRSPLDLARERVKEYLKEDLDPVLSDDLIREVHRIVQEAEMALLGRTTGILP